MSQLMLAGARTQRQGVYLEAALGERSIWHVPDSPEEAGEAEGRKWTGSWRQPGAGAGSCGCGKLHRAVRFYYT